MDFMRKINAGWRAMHGFNPNSEAGDHARPGRGWTRPRVQHWVREGVSQRVRTIPCTGVFREGAENSARGGHAPFSISGLGFNRKE
jgi:hypothetical protein